MYGRWGGRIMPQEEWRDPVIPAPYWGIRQEFFQQEMIVRGKNMVI